MGYIADMVPIDFEYNHSKDKVMNIVCASLEIDGVMKSFWLHKSDKQEFVDFINANNKRIFLSHNAVAESRAFKSLGLNPTQFKWIDNFVEHRMITNHNDRMMYGKQLIQGREVVTRRKQYGEEPSVRNSKPEHSLSATVYKMLGVKIDTTIKDYIREVIIRADENEIEEHKDRIIKYCESDIVWLRKVYIAHLTEYKRLIKGLDVKKFVAQQLSRGADMARTALIEELGYPINFRKVKNFALSTDDIMGDIAKDINRQFPDIKPFSYDRTMNRYKVTQKKIKDWIEASKYAKEWPQTKTGYSLAREAWEDRFKKGHEFIEGNFGSQMYRYYYTKQHLNGFQSTKGKERTFWDSVGSDGRVRAWLNPFRSQSARFQPTATDFIPLKASWMRALIEPPKGRAIIGIDYVSEEYLLGALLAKDKKMLEAYASGDVYMAFAIDSGMVPKGATKATHPKERQIAKAAVLGIGYGLTKVGLARDLDCSEEEAEKYIVLYNKTYNDHYKHTFKIAGGKQRNPNGTYIEYFGEYQKNGMLSLPCGWKMFGDNDNLRSVGNLPIQGFGSSVLRKAIELAQKKGLEVIFPLHDALYIECDQKDVAVKSRIFLDVMKEAFVHYFIGTDMEEASKLIRLDLEVWGFDHPTEIKIENYKTITAHTIHIDERGVSQYEQFSKYFEDDPYLGEV